MDLYQVHERVCNTPGPTAAIGARKVKKNGDHNKYSGVSTLESRLGGHLPATRFVRHKQQLALFDISNVHFYCNPTCDGCHWKGGSFSSPPEEGAGSLQDGNPRRMGRN